MLLSTSTNLLDKYRNKFGATSPEQCAAMCYSAGFEALDFNFCDQCRPGRPIAQDSWYEYIVEYKKFCDSLGMKFTQTHPHIYDPNDPTVKAHEWETELLERSMICSGILKTKWAVMHPLHRNKDNYSREKYLKMNIEYFRPYAEQAKKLGFGLAFENMVQADENYTYACNAEDLIELCDAFGMDNIGICWDFGHAEISLRNQGREQVEELRKIGSRLKATHVADNHGRYDEHIAPFYGLANWHEIMKVLKEIDYKGDFTYEIQEFTNYMPLEIRENQIKHLVEIGKYLINLY